MTYTVEVWRKVPGYACQVSSEGRVMGASGALIKQHFRRRYLSVQVRRDDHQPPRRRWPFIPVHVLVALAFIGPKPSEDHQGAHGDGIKTHNRPHNLRWATALEQAQDRDRHGTTARGTRVANAILTDEAVREIRHRYANRHLLGRHTYETMAEEFGVSRFAIYRVVKGIGWKHVQEFSA